MLYGVFGVVSCSLSTALLVCVALLQGRPDADTGNDTDGAEPTGGEEELHCAPLQACEGTNHSKMKQAQASCFISCFIFLRNSPLTLSSC